MEPSLEPSVEPSVEPPAEPSVEPPVEPMGGPFLRTGPADAAVRFLCAHGAGAGMDTPFLRAFAELLAERGVATFRFEFAYMAARGSGGSRKPPPKAEHLLDEYRAAVAAAGPDAPLVIGGKSMGGRVASLVADELHAAG